MDLLLTTAQSDQQFSCCLWDYKTLNIHKYYKNGGKVSPKCLELIGEDYILTSEIGKPLLHLWLLNSQAVAKNVRLVIPEPANCLAVCPQNIYLAVGIGCKLYMWHISSGKLLAVQQKNYQPVSVIKFSSDGDFLLVGGEDGMLLTYYLSDLLTVSSNYTSQSDLGKAEPMYVRKDHSMAIKDIHVGRFGRKSHFVTVSADRTCKIYNLLNGELECNLVFGNCLTSVIFDSSFGQLYVGMETGLIKQFVLKDPPRTLTHHVEDGKLSLEFVGHKSKIVCLALNAMETILASGSSDSFVYTWDVRKRQILKKIKHNSPITNVKFVMSYENFFAENIKPRYQIKSLQRSLEYSEDLMVSQLQTEDIETKDEEFVLSKKEKQKDMFEENCKLRTVNEELFNALVKIGTKTYLPK
ncbi:unnamed protein product [Phyllotreta striolata]|uniref:WD repeat-containing protein 18 n=1 Tax=Phyllotreta striolata TaxID=444603 RepID=A0A9N9XR49_PHYSR|nr:unnamed protein product [Phyllotreta striolata]